VPGQTVADEIRSGTSRVDPSCGIVSKGELDRSVVVLVLHDAITPWTDWTAGHPERLSGGLR